MRAVLGDDKVLFLGFDDVHAVEDMRVFEFLMDFYFPLNQGQGIRLIKFFHLDNLDGKFLFRISDEGGLENRPGVSLPKDVS